MKVYGLQFTVYVYFNRIAIKVNATEHQLKVGKDAGQYSYMMQTEIYNTPTRVGEAT